MPKLSGNNYQVNGLLDVSSTLRRTGLKNFNWPNIRVVEFSMVNLICAVSSVLNLF